MIEMIVSLIPGGGFAAAIGGVIAALFAFGALLLKARHDGRKDERADNLQRNAQSRVVADEVEQSVAGNDVATNRKEAAKWVKR